MVSKGCNNILITRIERNSIKFFSSILLSSYDQRSCLLLGILHIPQCDVIC